MRFTGQVKIPDLDYPGVPAVILVEDKQTELFVEGESLGRWSLVDVRAERLISAAFSLKLNDEEVTFIADQPTEFAYGGVDYMANVWAKHKAMRFPLRSVANSRSRNGTKPSRIGELRAAIEDALAGSYLTALTSRSDRARQEEYAAPQLLEERTAEAPPALTPTESVATEPEPARPPRRPIVEPEPAREEAVPVSEVLEDSPPVAPPSPAAKGHEVPGPPVESRRESEPPQEKQAPPAAEASEIPPEMDHAREPVKEASEIPPEMDHTPDPVPEAPDTPDVIFAEPDATPEKELPASDSVFKESVPWAKREVEEARIDPDAGEVSPDPMATEESSSVPSSPPPDQPSLAEETPAASVPWMDPAAVAPTDPEPAPPPTEGSEEPVEAVEAVEAGEPVEVIDELEAVDVDEPVETVEAVEAVEAVEPVEAVEAVEAGEPVEVVDELEAVDVDEPVETVEPGEPDGSSKQQFVVDLGAFEDPEEAESEPTLPEPQPAMAAASGKGGIMGAVRSAFVRTRTEHTHEFVEAPGGLGIVRHICTECGHISIGLSE